MDEMMASVLRAKAMGTMLKDVNDLLEVHVDPEARRQLLETRADLEDDLARERRKE